MPRSKYRGCPQRSICAPPQCRACSALRSERASWCPCGPESALPNQPQCFPLSPVKLSDTGQAANVPIEREEGVGGGKNRAARGLQRHAHNAGAAEHHLGLRLRRKPHNPAPSTVRSRHIKISVAIQGNTLRPAEAAEENAHLASLRYSVDAVKT